MSSSENNNLGENKVTKDGETVIFEAEAVGWLTNVPDHGVLITEYPLTEFPWFDPFNPAVLGRNLSLASLPTEIQGRRGRFVWHLEFTPTDDPKNA